MFDGGLPEPMAQADRGCHVFWSFKVKVNTMRQASILRNSEMMNAPSVLSRIFAFAAIGFVVGARCFGQAPADDVATPQRSPARTSEHDRLLQFVSIPSKALPKGVQLVQRVETAPLVLVARNPAVLVDAAMIGHVAAFFGINDQADLRAVRAGVVAIYQENDPSREIGVYGLWFTDRNAARKWSKKAKANSEGSPFFLKDDLALFVWKDDGVSHEAFTAVRDFFNRHSGRPRAQETSATSAGRQPRE